VLKIRIYSQWQGLSLFVTLAPIVAALQGERKNRTLHFSVKNFQKSPISIFMRESVQPISHMKIPLIGDFEKFSPKNASTVFWLTL
jgi:hypothetical protein